jgi:biopolymer transport protein ExbD
MRRVSSEEKDIDISPLIDVVFILLIFFMVSTTFVKDAQLDIERPSARSAESTPTEAVRVNVDRSGSDSSRAVLSRCWSQSIELFPLRPSSRSSTSVDWRARSMWVS